MPADALPLALIDAALRGAALALLALLGARLLHARPDLAAARAAALLCLGLGVQLISSTPLFEAEVSLRWQAPLIAVSVGNAVLFWVFVQTLFNDEFRLRPLHVLLWCGAAGVSLLNCLLAANGAASPLLPYTHGLQRAMPLVFTALSAAAAAAHWRGDLVERRRRLRVFVVVAGGLYALTMLALRLASPQGRLSGAAALLDAAWLLLILAALASALLGLRPLELLPLPAAPPGGPPDPAAAPAEVAEVAEVDAAERAQALALQARVRAERLYQAEDLSLASLATRLGLPEYRLRRLINQQLGHRNFNAFVNGLRLEAASAALADPACREQPVLSIALEAGFQSIGPFNRAFKAATGLTPSEFRRQRLAALR
ncbi:AraC family transcriptional regulator [Paucibacter sediminis]|uniref:AraC family transcriptional regulator n=1 Tax=Paucibacter sediminis TaxID=3019553 RepID=A0AA95SNE8_9BURK|nr:AraC family transcriptional regulator [Paucibacter sp. S2-9]WIT14318.1 AraC family transcriptional regulator [Paucibacter sp. S2-9]